ncbi:MAG: GreA/GreB family elongation factor, partial [Verrucomicrobiota bacterium]
GVDEVDPDRGWISWLSPVAKTLLQRRVGDQVCLRVPGGETPLTIVAMEYLP